MAKFIFPPILSPCKENRRLKSHPGRGGSPVYVLAYLFHFSGGKRSLFLLPVKCAPRYFGGPAEGGNIQVIGLNDFKKLLLEGNEVVDFLHIDSVFHFKAGV